MFFKKILILHHLLLTFRIIELYFFNYISGARFSHSLHILIIGYEPEEQVLIVMNLCITIDVK